MARITVEDCIDKFPSRFELVLVASNRARKLHSGENPTVEKDNDKNTVIALREISKETLSIEELKNDLIEEYQTITFSEDEEINENIENSEENSENDSNLIEANIEENKSDENIIPDEVEENKSDENIILDEVNEISNPEELEGDQDENSQENI